MNEKKIKVLLLSAPIGSGHRLAAEALQSAFEKYNNVEVVHGNVFDFSCGLALSNSDIILVHGVSI